MLFHLAMTACMFGQPADTTDKAIATIDKFIAEQKEAKKINTDSSGWKKSLPKPPKAEFDPGTEYFWVVETTKGTIKVKLMPKIAPMHVSSTIYLSRVGFYNDIKFHRVIKGFMAQGGCPDGNGRGGPGYKYDGEFSPTARHDRPFLLSMANAGAGTDGSQFFLTFKATPWLDDKHTIFGEVVVGQDVVRALESAGGGNSGQTAEPLFITTTSIETKKKS